MYFFSAKVASPNTDPATLHVLAEVTVEGPRNAVVVVCKALSKEHALAFAELIQECIVGTELEL